MSSPLEYALLVRARREQDRRRARTWKPWEPLPGPQTMAFTSQADVIGFGGSAGGGKSDMLLGMATLNHTHSIIFRRELKQVRALVERSHELIGTNGRFNGSALKWRQLPGGRSIEFGGVDSLKAARRYQGRPHDLVGFDEATEIPENAFRFLVAWNRTTDPEQPCRVVCTFNPPTTEEGRWVIRYWAPWVDVTHPHPADPGELVWYIRDDDTNEDVEVGRGPARPAAYPDAKSRTFIPAKLEDNPYYAATGYGATLAALPEPLRSQLRHGDFTAGIKDDPWQIIPRAWAEAAQARWQADGHGVPLSAMGVDVARSGADKTVICRRYGRWFAPLTALQGSDTPDGASVARAVLAEYEAKARVYVDVIGVGSSPYDILKATQGVRVEGVNVGAGSSATDRSRRLGFANKKAELWWKLREALDPDTGHDLALPPDPELLSDLCAPRWSLHSGRVAVESKEDVRKRIGRSPDKGDALVLALIEAKPLYWTPGRR